MDVKNLGELVMRFWRVNKLIDEDFVICNADDYYGKDAFKQAYDFIQQNQNKNNMLWSPIKLKIR